MILWNRKILYCYTVKGNKSMVNKKTCWDCGRQFTPSDEAEKKDVCEDCLSLQKRRFWSSIKMGNIYDESIRRKIQNDKENKNTQH
jgi:hypothetical protein